MFGSDASALMGRKPDISFSKLYRMLGRPIDHPLVQEIPKNQYFPYTIQENTTTGGVSLKVDEIYYTPEELMGMIFTNIKEMTHHFGGNKNIKDCVITVPSYFTQHEKEALYTAADIADLKVLSLIEENTAAALHYAMDRTFDNGPSTVLYYNMGAGSTQVTIVTYSSYIAKELGGKNKTITNFEVVGKAWDDSLGGFAFDLTLTNLLADRFNDHWVKKKGQGKAGNIKEHIRPMTRLRIESNKVKEVLSANQDFPIRAEQLHADLDLITKITRTEFEEACAPLFAKLVTPIELALQMANMSLAQIDAVELLGGGVRMPKVKKTLDEYFKQASNTVAGAGADKAADTKTTADTVAMTPKVIDVGQHLNGDEAMALGAAFRAANLSTAFRVRKIGMQDITSFPISVRIETMSADGSKIADNKADKKAADDEADKKWSKKAVIYTKKAPIIPGKTKTVTFPYDQDVTCTLEYSDTSAESLLPEGTNPVIAVYNITGIAAFTKEYREKGLLAKDSAPKLQLLFTLDNSGRVSLVKAEVTIEIPKNDTTSSATPAADSEAAAGAANSTSTAEDAGTATEPASADTNAADSEEAGATKADTNSTTAEADSKVDATKAADSAMKAPATPAKPANSILRRSLTITESLHLVHPPRWTATRIEEARQRIRALQVADDIRKAKAAAMNDLEAYIYKIKNRIQDDGDTVLSKVSTDEQRDKVMNLANSIEEWLYDDGRDQSVSVYHEKQADLKATIDPILKRLSELTARPEAITAGKKVLEDIKKVIVNNWTVEKYPQITEEEKTELLAAIEKADTWMEEKSEAQEKVSVHETPIFESTEVFVQVKPVKSMYEKLLKKPKPAPVILETKVS